MSTAILRRTRVGVLPVVIGLAWVLAAITQASGTGHSISHDNLVGDGAPGLAALALFAAAWQAHVAAMMLPSSMPMIELFGRAASGQRRPRLAASVFVGGYAFVWTVFGVVALAGDSVLHQVVHRSAWLEAHPELLMGGALVLAGAFQFSDLKDRCLTECRHPAAFLQRYYRRGLDEAFRLGMRHGVSCLGCCWALMILMFAVGIANLLWMAPLALLMAAEKTWSQGQMLVRPVGAVLLIAGTGLITATVMPGLA
jgi:predicted metal-binding membrane protein